MVPNKDLKKGFEKSMLFFADQTRNVLLTYFLAEEELRDFPQNLSEKSFNNLNMKNLKEYFEFKRLVDEQQTQTDDYYTILKNLKMKDQKKKITSYSFLTHTLIDLFNQLNGIDDLKRESILMNLQYTINAQAVVMLNSNLEGLLRETINLLQKLNSDLPEFKETKNTKMRLIYLRKKCKLTLKKFELEDKLDEMGKYRHIIVHNNGIINEKFLKGKKFTEQKLGDRIDISSDFIFTFGTSMFMLASDLYKTIKKKYFQETDES